MFAIRRVDGGGWAPAAVHCNPHSTGPTVQRWHHAAGAAPFFTASDSPVDLNLVETRTYPRAPF